MSIYICEINNGSDTRITRVSRVCYEVSEHALLNVPTAAHIATSVNGE